jgi:hypothetical protein
MGRTTLTQSMLPDQSPEDLHVGKFGEPYIKRAVGEQIPPVTTTRRELGHRNATGITTGQNHFNRRGLRSPRE